MNKEEVEKLAKLARLELGEGEIGELSSDMSSILSYVDKLKKASADLEMKPEAGELHNRLRNDEVLHEPESYTDDLVSLAPNKKGRHVTVKKIL